MAVENIITIEDDEVNRCLIVTLKQPGVEDIVKVISKRKVKACQLIELVNDIVIRNQE